MTMNVGRYFSPYSILYKPSKTVEITPLLCARVCLNKRYWFAFFWLVFQPFCKGFATENAGGTLECVNDVIHDLQEVLLIHLMCVR